MRKIEWDVVNGVYVVESFGDDTKIVKGELALDYLKDDSEGTWGAEVDSATYRTIKKEYGFNPAVVGIEKVAPHERGQRAKGGRPPKRQA